jgi:hypothetical protein
MKWIKAVTVGLIGSLFMFVLIMLGINAGVAPFNTPPSGAFLAKLGIAKGGPLPLLAHFGYGALGSVVLVAFAGRRTNASRGLLLAGALWLFMMLVYSPIIGWGVFGIGGPGHALPADHALHLGVPVKYVASTAVLHLVYGAVVGWGNARWTVRASERTGASSVSRAGG